MALNGRTTSSGEHATIGLLFVHGIGLHSRAATIIRFGTRLLDDLTRWLPDGYQARVTSASIELDRVGPEPAHAVIEINGPNGFSTSWLIAESWWSGVFSKPRYRDVAAWGVKIAPVTIAFHMQRRFDRALERFVMSVIRDRQRLRDGQWGGVLSTALTRVWLSWWHLVQLGGELAAFLVGLVVIPLVVVLIIVLVIVGFVPIPPLQRFIRSVQQALTGSIGDSFILLDSPLQGAAIIDRIFKDYEWLRLHSDRQVLMAHSQGAAVSHTMIRNLLPEARPASFITFGSGIKKLNELRLIKKSRSRWLPWLTTLSFLAIAWFAWQELRTALRSPNDLRELLFTTYCFGLVAVGIQLAVLRKPTGRSFALLVILYGLLAGATAYVASSESVSLMNAVVLFVGLGTLFIAMGALRPQDLPAADLTLGVERWIDIFASNDPVANGSLGAAGLRGMDPAKSGVDPVKTGSRFEEHEVHNSGSMLRDHSTYWINSEQFVIPLIRFLGQAQVPPVFFRDSEDGDIEDRLRLRVASDRRRWRVRWLSWIRGSVIGLALLAAVFGNRNVLLSLGSPINRAMGSAVAWIPWIDATIKTTSAKIFTSATGFGRVAAVVLGWVVVAMVLTAGYGLLLLIWKWWTDVDIRALVARRDFMRMPLALLVLTALAILIATSVVWLGFESQLLVRPRMSPISFVLIAFVLAVVVLAVKNNWVAWSRGGTPHEALEARATSLRNQLLMACELEQATFRPVILLPVRLVLDPSPEFLKGFLPKRISKAYELLVLEAYELLAACRVPFRGIFADLSAALAQTPPWETRTETT